MKTSTVVGLVVLWWLLTSKPAAGTPTTPALHVAGLPPVPAPVTDAFVGTVDTSDGCMC